MIDAPPSFVLVLLVPFERSLPLVGIVDLMVVNRSYSSCDSHTVTSVKKICAGLKIGCAHS